MLSWAEVLLSVMVMRMIIYASGGVKGFLEGLAGYLYDIVHFSFRAIILCNTMRFVEGHFTSLIARKNISMIRNAPMTMICYRSRRLTSEKIREW
jgi:hypothetical protein